MIRSLHFRIYCTTHLNKQSDLIYSCSINIQNEFGSFCINCFIFLNDLTYKKDLYKNIQTYIITYIHISLQPFSHHKCVCFVGDV